MYVLLKSYFILLYTNSQYYFVHNAILYEKELLSMKPLKTKVSITLDSDVIEMLKQLAEEDDRSFSQYINSVLKKYLEA